MAAIVACATLGASAADEPTFEDLIEATSRSVVVIRSSDREASERGLGSGFVIRSDGVIVTSLHVIGRGRPFRVQFADGTEKTPVAILAFDELLDLAIVRVEAEGLPTLALGDSSALRSGQSVAAVGNPLGFRWSASRGVVAATDRQVLGRPMVQLAMPIEPGSSGSPVVDLDGRVVGVVTIKSGDAVGFAAPSRDVDALLERLEPVPIDRWITIGSLDETEWATVHGGEWRQRAGRLIASGSGRGFAGRMLCLHRDPPPTGTFEVETEVKLDDEGGAAGLVFHADGGDLHYGFYPTAGSIRFTLFQGADVLRWTILSTFETPHYRPGDWNRLKVRVEDGVAIGFVNDEEVLRLPADRLEPGAVGLVKFREPGASFRRFRIGASLAPHRLDEGVEAEIDRLAAQAAASPLSERRSVDDISTYGEPARALLLDRARALEGEVARLRDLAGAVHRRRVQREIVQALAVPRDAVARDADPDLLRASLLLAALDNPELEVEPYLDKFDRLAKRFQGGLDSDIDEDGKLAAVLAFLFEELGFRGSTGEYYHRSNSYLSEVIDDREGLPISLSVVLIEFARRVGLRVVGVGIPRHFICKFTTSAGEEVLIDAFGGGRIIDRAEAERLSATALSDAEFTPATEGEIIRRMLYNLLSLAESDRDGPRMLRYLDVLLALDGDSAQHRWLRARLRYFSGDRGSAIEDLDWLLTHLPVGIDPAEVRELRQSIDARSREI